VARYVVKRRYGSRRDGQQYGPWIAGTEVEMSESDADWVNRDSPGVLELIVVVEPEVVEVEPPEDVELPKAPAKNRMRTGGPTRAVDF